MVMLRAVLGYRQRAAGIGCRHDMPDYETMATAEKPAVGNHCHILAQTFAHDRRVHFSDAGAAFGAFVADHNHIVFDDKDERPRNRTFSP